MNLHWNANKERQLRLAIKKKKKGYFPSGVSATFIKLNKNVGIKLFESGFQRNYSYRGQERAAKYNLAPRIGDKLKVRVKLYKHSSSDIYYGFVTQVADMRYQKKKKHKHDPDDNLYNKLRSINIFHEDLHDSNWGYIGNRPVVIDFDSASCSIKNMAKSSKKRQKANKVRALTSVGTGLYYVP